MNRISNLLGVLLLLLTACSKTETQNTTGGGVSPMPPPFPTLILKADTAWYNGSATITVTSDAQSVTNLNTNQIVTGPVVITGLKKDSIISFVAKNTNGTLTSTTTRSIVVHNYSERMTLWCNYGLYHQIYGKWCFMDSLQYPNAWHPTPIDCNTIQFLPNGTAFVTIGPCGPFPGQTFPGAPWSFQNNETVFWNGVQAWTIDYVNTAEWQAYKIEPVTNDPYNRSAKTVIRYSH